jgi:hypothetical protein
MGRRFGKAGLKASRSQACTYQVHADRVEVRVRTRTLKRLRVLARCRKEVQRGADMHESLGNIYSQSIERAKTR